MRNRWGILAVLFIVRLTMAFQFQSVAAVAPLLGAKFDASLADIGLLIGLYLTPGVALSLPGGEIGRRLGDKATVAGALLLMLIGQLAMVASDSWGWQIAGRLIAGGGAVLLGVMMTKMVTDWFAGKEIATAMAIFVTSWPAGIATSLLTLPAVGTVYGVSAAYLSVAALIGLGIPLLVVGYRSPSIAAAAPSAPSRLDRNTLFAVIIAGLIWGVFNIGFTMIFSFGPTLLVERGWSITAAGSAISIVLWLAALSGIAGGFLADWTERPQSVLVIGCLLFALLMLMLPRSEAVIPIVIAIGAISALPAGPIMSLPARVLEPQTRAIGMGIFFTVFYVVMMLGPAIAGAIAKWAGSAAAALDFGTAALLACPVLLWGYNRIVALRPQAA
ncbi:CynX/NimT family MFS transporter [Bradyrhizobium icense]|uniref:Arabinose ABC transporter permease n=1 Tax=Bradyrhizobium icense TaxID=1274631 RepID=A0A1B1UFG3_9BRAD|nr:MFS transporter [Bradyrhizobium icense]ANW01481.1 arabinose ABC transporter permease [Bradyrhizobium icense]